MNKVNYLLLSGLSLLAAGAILLFSESIGISTSKILVPICLILGSVFAFLFSRANKHHKIANQFHLLQSLGLLVFGVLIAMVPKNLESFLNFTTYFIMAYGLFEIMFAFAVLNSNVGINRSILFVRLATGLINLLGGFILIITLSEDIKTALTVAGCLIVIGGLGFIWFANKTKKQAI